MLCGRVSLAVRTRYTLAALLALVIGGALVVFALGSGGSNTGTRAGSQTSVAVGHIGASAPKLAPTTPPAQRATVPATRVGAPNLPAGRRALAVEQPDPYAAQSFPVARSNHAVAVAPATAGSIIAPGAPSDAQVQQELAQMQAATRAQDAQRATAAIGGSIGGNGTVSPPPGVPAVVARVIAGANTIANFPYIYGGGHASFVDNAYDCSGSVSYALAAGGLISIPETSGQLESWGVPGPGRWITVEARAGHTYMYIAGLRYDTAGRSGPYSSRWQTAILTNAGFVTRHYPGL